MTKVFGSSLPRHGIRQAGNWKEALKEKMTIIPSTAKKLIDQLEETSQIAKSEKRHIFDKFYDGLAIQSFLNLIKKTSSNKLHILEKPTEPEKLQLSDFEKKRFLTGFDPEGNPFLATRVLVIYARDNGGSDDILILSQICDPRGFEFREIILNYKLITPCILVTTSTIANLFESRDNYPHPHAVWHNQKRWKIIESLFSKGTAKIKLYNEPYSLKIPD